MVVAKKYDALEQHLRDAEVGGISVQRDGFARQRFATVGASNSPMVGQYAGQLSIGSWINAGWVVSTVDLPHERVVFIRGTPRTRGTGGGARQVVQDGAALLELMLDRAGYASVEAAVAMHTLFLDPWTVAQAKGRAMFPVVREQSRVGEIGELPGAGRVLFDDNATPTDCFLWAAERRKGPDIQFNHVWTASKDPRSYTALWNLCCTPAFLAKTTDTHAGVGEMLRYRSWDLFREVPAGESTPERPPGYGHLVWAESPSTLEDLEATLRSRMGAAPSRRACLAAREIGWAFSNGPDTSV